jgi:hypothetical protein
MIFKETVRYLNHLARIGLKHPSDWDSESGQPHATTRDCLREIMFLTALEKHKITRSDFDKIKSGNVHYK